MEKQGGMVFGFRKTAIAVIEMDRQTDVLMVGWMIDRYFLYEIKHI
jgi:hypothetical protein